MPPLACVGFRSIMNTEVTFPLTSGGHNAGIISEPGHSGRRYRVATKREAECCYVDPQDWLENTPLKEGSWWPEWQAWLVTHSSGKVKPPRLGARSKGYKALGDAPGAYVRQP